MFCNKCVLQFDKKYVFDLHLKLVHGEKKPFNETEKLEASETEIKPEIIFSLSEEGGIDHPLAKSELIKSEVKTEVKEEPFEKFEAREQGGIDFITSTNFEDLVLPSHVQENDNVFGDIKDENSDIGENKKEKTAEIISETGGKDSENFEVDSERVLVKKKDGKELNTSCKFTDVDPLTTSVHEGNKLHKCHLCDFRCSRKDNLDRHILSLHERKKTFSCPFCDKSFDGKNYMKVHIESVHEDMCHNCSICKSVFANASSLKTHVARVHEEKQLNKELIQNHTATHFLKSRHKIREEPNESNVPLKKFKQDFNQSNYYPTSKTIDQKIILKMASVKDSTNSVSDLNKDFSTVVGERNGVKCKFCQVLVKSTTIDNHIRLLHTVKCKFCLKRFAIGADMNAHILSVHSQTIQCEFCPAKFAKGAVMNAHVTSVHAMKCIFCPAKFLTKKGMDQHVLTAGHTILDLNKPLPVPSATVHVKCKFCHEVVNSAVMDEHILKVHGVQCKLCQKFFKSAFMDEHILKVHGVQCKFCPAKFITKRGMDQHELTTGHRMLDLNKDDKCNLCQEFVKDTTMDEHLKSIHAIIKCPYCPKNFANSAILSAQMKMKKHVRLVHAIKCRFCHKKIFTDEYMNVHLSSVHYIKCQSCPAKLLTNKDMDQHELTTGHKILDLSQKI